MGDQLIFHLGLAHSSCHPLVLLVVLEAEEDLLGLEVEGQGLLARMPIGRKFASFLGRGATEGNSFAFFFTSMESNSLAAATCLTISLGFLATHLDRDVTRCPKSSQPDRGDPPGVAGAEAHLPLLVQQESRPRHHPTPPLDLRQSHHKMCQMLLTPKALARSRLLSLMMGKPVLAEMDHCGKQVCQSDKTKRQGLNRSWMMRTWRMATTLSPEIATTFEDNNSFCVDQTSPPDSQDVQDGPTQH